MTTMKRLILFCAFSLLLTGGSFAASVDEVVDKHIRARGGLEAWNAVQTMKTTGHYTGFSLRHPFTLIKKRPNLYYFDHILGDRPVIIGYDGETSWWVNTWYELDWAIRMSPVDTATVIQDTSFATPFFHYKDNGLAVKLLEENEFEGEKAIALQLTRPDGAEETWYLDPETHLEIARVSQISDFGYMQEGVTLFSDFRKVGGLVVPHFVETEFGIRHRIMEIDSIVFNVEVEDELFRMPTPVPMEKLAPLAGEWSVKVEEPTRPDTPWKESRVESTTIESLGNGGLLLEHLRVVLDDIPTEVLRQWSYDHSQKRYRLTVFDDTTMYINVLEGTFEEGRLVLKNVDTGTFLQLGDAKYHGRVILSEIGPDTFKLEQEISRDGGENWRPGVRMTYERKRSGSGSPQ